MKIQSVSCVYFSPTGTTKAITESIAQGINPEFVEMVDITKRSHRECQPLSFKLVFNTSFLITQ
jgi:flavodoxin